VFLYCIGQVRRDFFDHPVFKCNNMQKYWPNFVPVVSTSALTTSRECRNRKKIFSVPTLCKLETKYLIRKQQLFLPGITSHFSSSCKFRQIMGSSKLVSHLKAWRDIPHVLET